jgi:DNA polymerase-3 subunit gamma/tau
VSISNRPGEPTLAEQKKAAHTARLESVMGEPMVRAILDRFPGSEVVAVREVTGEDVAPPSESDE